MKRIISLILILALTFLSTPAIAVNASITEDSNADFENQLKQVTIVSNGHGEYIKADDNPKNDTETLIASITNEAGIYLMPDKSYVSYVGNDKYLAVDLLELNQLTDISALAKQYDIPEEIIKHVEKSRSHLLETKNTEAVMCLVVPQISSAKSTYTNYYTSQGYSLKDYWYYIEGDATIPTEVISGINTKAIIEGISQIAMVGIGMIPVFGAIYTGGVSVIQAFYDMGNPPVTPSGSDYMYTVVDLDHYTKWTSLSMGGYYEIGCVTQLARVTQVINIVHFTGSATQVPGQLMIKVQQSPDWLDPAPIAIQWAGNPMTEYFDIQVGGITIQF